MKGEPLRDSVLWWTRERLGFKEIWQKMILKLIWSLFSVSEEIHPPKGRNFMVDIIEIMGD